MSELKPCAHCGGEAKGVRVAKAYHVYCTYCGADVMESTIKAMTTCQVNTQKFKAEQKWNQRAETETEKRLTAIATNHATRADELYEALDNLLELIDSCEGLAGINRSQYIIEPSELSAVVEARVTLDKSRIEAEGK